MFDNRQVTAREPIYWNKVEIDNGGHYSTDIGAYTVPYNGTYQ